MSKFILKILAKSLRISRILKHFLKELSGQRYASKAVQSQMCQVFLTGGNVMSEEV